MVKKSVIFILLLFYLAILKAQEYYYIKYTEDDGLPCNELFDIIQDKKGYLWIATSDGVVRYDGYEFKVFNTQNGLPENSILRLYEDLDGKIWLSSYEGNLYYIENNQAFSYSLNPLITRFSRGVISPLVDSNRNLYFTKMEHGGALFHVVGKHLEVEQFRNCLPKDEKNWRFYIRSDDNGYIIDGLKDPKKSEEVECPTLKKVSKNEYLLNVPYHYYNIGTKNCYSKYSNDHFLFSSNACLYEVEKDKVNLRKDFKRNIYSILVDRDSNIWVCIGDFGALCYRKGDLGSVPIHLFGDLPISKVIQDVEGNYWFASHGYGLYFLPSIKMKCAYFEAIGNSDVRLMDIRNDILLSYLWDENIYKIDLKKERVEKYTYETERDFKDYFGKIKIDSKGDYWLLGSEHLRYTSSGKKNPLDTLPMNNGSDIIETSQNVFIIGEYFGIVEYADGKMIYRSKNKGFRSKVSAFYEDADGKVWIGTNKGLYLYKRDGQKRSYRLYNNLNVRIRDITGFGNTLCVGTGDWGIYVINDDNIRMITEKDGLLSHHINVMFCDSRNNVWVGTNKGLSKLVIDVEDSLKCRIQNFTTWDGLPSNKINDIQEYKDQIYVATRKGLVKFCPDCFEKKKPYPVVYIEKVVAGNHQYKPTDNPQLTYRNNSVKISFVGVSYQGTDVLKYKYKLEGLTDGWEETTNRVVEFAYLPPGKYKFIVEVQDKDGNRAETPAEFEFRILKAFYQKWSFKIAVGIIIAMTIGLIFYIRIRNIRKKNRQRHQMTHLQQQALSKQMNPHFIYNSLNSIHNYILLNDRMASSRYLSMFSKLMRMTLEISRKQFIDVEDEVTTLKLYLDLESMRIKGKISYKIHVDETIYKAGYKVPAFFIQPFVENAIWHGLMHKDGEKKLDISLTLVGRKLVCTIEDNGVGREASGKYQRTDKKNQKSRGIGITKKRLELLYNIWEGSPELDIIDMMDESGEPVGTKVVIVFPAIDTERYLKERDFEDEVI